MVPALSSDRKKDAIALLWPISNFWARMSMLGSDGKNGIDFGASDRNVFVIDVNGFADLVRSPKSPKFHFT